MEGIPNLSNAINFYQDSQLSHMLEECEGVRNPHNDKRMAILCLNEGCGGHMNAADMLTTSKVTYGDLFIYLLFIIA